MLTRYIQDAVSPVHDGVHTFGGFDETDNHGDDGSATYVNVREAENALMLENRKILARTTEDVDIFRTVLWLRSKRRFLVQEEVNDALYQAQYGAHFVHVISKKTWKPGQRRHREICIHKFGSR